MTQAFSHGCCCNLCPLGTRNSGGPVFGAGPDARLAIVGEAPGENEVREGKPFIGASGLFLDKILKRRGISRKGIKITNALLCRPPDNLSLGDFLSTLPKGTADPLLCCRERLLRELRNADFIILLGGTSLKAVTGLTDGIKKWRGSPLRVVIPKPLDRFPSNLSEVPTTAEPATDGKNCRANGESWVLPTYHPAFVMKQGQGQGKVFATTVENDLAKAIRIWQNDKTEWDETAIHPFATVYELVSALARARASKKVVSVDVETDGEHVLETNLRVVGFAWSNEAWVIPFTDISDELWPYQSEEERDLVWRALYSLLADSNVPKLFHNSLYDLVVLERHGFEVSGPKHDSMLMHHATWSELPHSLAFVSSVYTDIRFWKEDIKDTGKHKVLDCDQLTYHVYNCRDTLATLRSANKIVHEKEFAEQKHIYAHSLALVPLAREMQARGMWYDPEQGAKIRNALFEQERKCSDRMKQLLKETDYSKRSWEAVEQFAPSGQKAIRHALLSMGVPLVTRTSTALLKTDALTLASLMPFCSIEAREFLNLLTRNQKGDEVDPSTLGWRPAMKLRTTYLDNPPVLQDGRIHANWKLHGTVSGRFSSDHPNMQNWPAWVRVSLEAEPSTGYVLVGADFSQIEMRIQAFLSGCPGLKASFEFEDSHTARAAMLFEVPYEEVTYHQRLLAKRYIYQVSYGGADESIYQKLLPEYPGLRLEMVIEVGKRIKQAYPRWMAWRKALIEATYRNRFACSAILGRRRYFLGGLKATEILNFPVQSTAADVINLAALKIWEIKKKDWPDVYLINQCHDSLTFEVPEQRAEKFERMLEELLPGPYNLAGAGKCIFPAKVKIGKSWLDV